MAYDPTNWKSGDVVTAAKLNKLEQGVANGGVLVVGATIDSDKMVLDKTWQEIYDALQGGVFISMPTQPGATQKDIIIAKSAGIEDEYYFVSVPDYNISFETESADGYPSALM